MGVLVLLLLVLLQVAMNEQLLPLDPPPSMSFFFSRYLSLTKTVLFVLPDEMEQPRSLEHEGRVFVLGFSLSGIF